MRKRLSFLIITACLLLGACRRQPLTLFTSLNKDQTGIDFRNLLEESDDMNVLNYSYFYNGGGVAIGDINNDSLPDILFTGNMVKNRLFLNKGHLEFEDITQKSGIANMQGWCTGATMADVNGDGYTDIYICRSADIDPAKRKNLLFINNGNLTFTEKAADYGLADEGYSTQASFFDYDKDGDLDLFLINHSLQQYTTGVQENMGMRKQQNPFFASKLYRNDKGRYSDVSREAGIISNVLSFGLGLAVSDINNDNWPDVYISNDFNEPDYLFINNRNGTFTESLNRYMDIVSLYSMGSDAADYNNDGWIDIITLDMLPEDNRSQKMHSGAENFDKMQMLFKGGFYYQFSRNMLQRNNGDGTFSEVAQQAGVSNTDWSWAALFSDFDNDGRKDLFVTNGYVKDYTDMDFVKYSVDQAIKASGNKKKESLMELIHKMPSVKKQNCIYRNTGHDTIFQPCNREWGLEKTGIAAGAAYADLDNDGDMDLVISNTNDYAGIYRNNSEHAGKHNYLKVRLHGTPENSAGIGAKVMVYAGGEKYLQEQVPVRGFQSSVDPVLTFGLGPHQLLDSVVVMWPNDQTQCLSKVNARQTLTLNIRNARNTWQPNHFPPAPRYTDTAAVLDFTHHENEVNDFTVQTLLPHYLSRQGPCMARADVNNDKREDLYIGGGKGQAGQLFIQTASGQFTASAQPALDKDAFFEDVAATFFDADGDGDADLYTGSGGYALPPTDPALQGRLYINDGQGHFSKKEDALPSLLINTGCVKAEDIDGDGDQDLFIGGRATPQQYPLAPESKLLFNDGAGRFTDRTSTFAPKLQRPGMVTDAAWVDVNADHINDLVIAGEWMPVKVFINHRNRLEDASDRYIKFASTGWWNRILAADLDGDGDQDLVIGNLGQNAQFRASEKEPVCLYYKDFDSNGSIDPIFCYYIGGTAYPAASRDDLVDQLPLLKKKFLAYHRYADATINDIFTPAQLKDAGLLKATTLSTIYLENKGTAGFTPHPLPPEAQEAPVYGIAAVDADHDGHTDLVLAGNNTWTRIRFSRYTANHGILLRGNGKGDFAYVPQWSSGLQVRENVRSLQCMQAGTQTVLLFGCNNAPVKSYAIRDETGR